MPVMFAVDDWTQIAWRVALEGSRKRSTRTRILVPVVGRVDPSTAIAVETNPSPSRVVTSTLTT